MMKARGSHLDIRRVVLISSLGYFVDIFDLFLFSVLRVPSLQSLNLTQEQVFSQGTLLLNAQMAGLLVGSFFWGIAGDRIGRVKILYASILVYSAATLANAFVQTVDQYFICRVIAGFGLAGELGAAITLVSETMSKESRGIGTTIVGAMGLAGGIAAAFLSKIADWRTCYIVGGLMGLGLLALRLRLHESSIFTSVSSERSRGNFFLILKDPSRFAAFLRFILIGLPIWFVAGVMIAFSPELAKALGVQGNISAADAVMYSYFGVTLGDVLCGYVSQKFKSRRFALMCFLIFTIVCGGFYFFSMALSVNQFLLVCFLIGIGTGYWAVLLTMAAEHFGTNLRATVSTIVPNLIRAAAIPMTLSFRQMIQNGSSALQSGVTVGIVVVFLAATALYFSKDTFGKDLEFLES